MKHTVDEQADVPGVRTPMRTLFPSYRVSDLGRSLAFYTTLGYVCLGKVETDDAALAMLRFPGEPTVTLELVHRRAGGPVQPGGCDHTAVQVENLTETVARLARDGLEIGPLEHPAGPDGPHTAFVSDPDGYRIELVQWPPGHPDGITEADFPAEPHEPSVEATQ